MFRLFGPSAERRTEDGRPVFYHGGGGSSQPSKTTTTSEPPKYLQPFLREIAGAASAAYAKVPKDGYSGALTAGPTAAQLQAIDQQKTIAAGLGGLGSTTQAIADQQAQKVLTGGYTSAANNNYNGAKIDTTAAVNAATAPLLKNLQENILPQHQSNAIKSGAYGGSRYFADQGKQITDNFTSKAQEIAAGLGYNELVRQDEQGFEGWKVNQGLTPELLKLEQTAALTAPELQNSAVNQNLTQSQILNNAGTAEQLNAQDALDELYQQYLLSVNGPFAGLDNYASIIGGTNTGGTSTSTGQKASGGSFLSGALGGGVGGYGLASALSLSNPWTAAAVGGGALLGGLFS